MQAIEPHAGTNQALSFFLRELEALPGRLLRQHWLTIKKQQDPLTSLAESSDVQVEERQPGTWGSVFQGGVAVPISLLFRPWGSPCCRAALLGWRRGVHASRVPWGIHPWNRAILYIESAGVGFYAFVGYLRPPLL